MARAFRDEKVMIHLVAASRRARGSGLGRIKVIVGGVAAFCFGVLVRLVAADSGRFASVRVQALNCCHVREQAFAGVADDIHEQPWD